MKKDDKKTRLGLTTGNCYRTRGSRFKTNISETALMDGNMEVRT